MEGPGNVWRRIPMWVPFVLENSTQVKTHVCFIVMTKDSFILECACNDPGNCPIGACECDGQLRINEDCTLAK